MILGLVLALRLYWLLVVFGVLVAFQARQAQREAKALEEKFGHAYFDYRKQTWF